MHISRIRLRNFKSFYSETEIDFDNLTGLWRVSGQIGAGKTTIGEAIIYGLYGKVADKNNGSLISWGRKKALVELWGQSRGHNLYIRREINSYGQSPMSVEVDGKPLISTDKRSIQNQLEADYLDTPRTSMELLCIISFNNFKSLSTLNTKDTKLFLDSVLGFDELTKYVEGTKQIQKELEDRLTENRADIRAIRSQIDRMENYKFIDGDPEALRSEITELQSNLTDIRKRANERLNPLKESLETYNRHLQEVTALGKIKAKEIKFIQQGTCPTCGAPIDSSQLAIKERERENLGLQYKEISGHINDLTGQISNISSELNNYATEKLSLIKSKENELIRLTEQSRMTVVNRSEIEKLKARMEELEETAKQYVVDLAEYDQLNNILQVQIRQQMLASFIPAINRKIQEISGLLNMKFVPRLDQMFKCSIVSGQEVIPTSSLSTGQLKMVDMIIILAVLGSIISKVQSNVIFLDELFSNLDPRTRAELVSVLRLTLPSTSSILIISHQDMDTEIFDGHIRMKLRPLEDGHEETIINYN